MEYFVAVRIEFARGERRDNRGEEYADLACEFYEAVSEVLGAGEFESPMTLSERSVGTYVYMPAKTPGEAATSAVRLLSEAAERVWGAGTQVQVERVITEEERDLELDRELGESA